ncbi:MAG: SDR family NAD(P)-dependent oxidoreductase [Rhodoferax sp.]|nr:SDR family NAD(P)-dependent oxidoreductase [Rhodoferax sp.]
MSTISARLAQFRKILVFYGRFLPSFTAIGYHARRLFWPPYAQRLDGQTWLVSGASSGVGQAIALEAERRGARVLAVARNAERLRDLTRTLDRDAEGGAPTGHIEVRAVDLSLKNEVHRLAQSLLQEGVSVDVLVNNVGLMLGRFRQTPEGHETSFATNLLGQYILTETLIQGQGLRRGGAVINMSSGGMYNVPLAIGPMDARDAASYNGVRAYALAKRGQAALVQHWAQVYGVSRDLQFYVMHPGWSDTEGVRTAMPRFRRILKSVLRTPAQGGDTALWLGTVRPRGTNPEGFWLDRAPRSAHAYPHTRHPRNQPAELAQYLQSVSNPQAPGVPTP